MKRMDEKQIVALKAIVRAVVALVINIGLAIRKPNDETVQNAIDVADGMVETINMHADDLGGE